MVRLDLPGDFNNEKELKDYLYKLVKNLRYALYDTGKQNTQTQNIQLGDSESEYRTQIRNLIFPVGTVTLRIDNTDPTILYGGTWVRIAKGRALIGVDEDDTDFSEAAKTGGAKTHTQTVSEMPAHTHYVPNYNANGYDQPTGAATYGGTKGYNAAISTLSAGDGQAMDIMNPYFTVYVWMRTA